MSDSELHDCVTQATKYMDRLEEEEEDAIVTVQEYIDDVDAQELEADLVLGGDEGKECTYKNGYMPRQAVFSCLTCTSKGNAGVCTGCVLSCHDGHEVVELWTKRHFRCDCGNLKFAGKTCKLWQEKDAENDNNTYNQNFLGLYCTCHRPYPDKEGLDLGEMLQCCICEDWYHESHIGLAPNEQVPKHEDGELAFDEFVCPACLDRCNFLEHYKEFIVQPASISEKNPIIAHDIEDHKKSRLQICIDNNKGNENGDCSSLASIAVGANNVSDAADEVPSSEGCKTSCPQVGTSDNGLDDSCRSVASSVLGNDVNGGLQRLESTSGSVVGPKEASGCKLAGHLGSADPKLAALFLERGWREKICKCHDCLQMYEARGLSFLVQEMDTMHEYEEMAKQRRKRKQEEEEGASAAFIRNLNHVHKVELLHGLNDMTSGLTTFFGEFKESGKTITSADVHEFFDKLTKKRKGLSD